MVEMTMAPARGAGDFMKEDQNGEDGFLVNTLAVMAVALMFMAGLVLLPIAFQICRRCFEFGYWLSKFL